MAHSVNPPPCHPHPTRNPAKKSPETLPTISPIRRTIDPVSSQPAPESEETPAAGRALQPSPSPLTPLLSRFWPQAIENKYFSRFNIAQTAENKQLIFRIHPKHFLGGSTRGNAPPSVQISPEILLFAPSLVQTRAGNPPTATPRFRARSRANLSPRKNPRPLRYSEAFATSKRSSTTRD